MSCVDVSHTLLRPHSSRCANGVCRLACLVLRSQLTLSCIFSFQGDGEKSPRQRRPSSPSSNSSLGGYGRYTPSRSPQNYSRAGRGGQLCLRSLACLDAASSDITWRRNSTRSLRQHVLSLHLSYPQVPLNPPPAGPGTSPPCLCTALAGLMAVGAAQACPTT